MSLNYFMVYDVFSRSDLLKIFSGENCSARAQSVPHPHTGFRRHTHTLFLTIFQLTSN